MALRIRSLAATHGFLKNVRYDFAGGFTCLVGPNAHGKSIVVELLGFAFGCDPKRISLLLGKKEEGAPEAPAFHGMIKACLGEGKVVVELEDEVGPLVLERVVGGEPVLHRDGQRVPTSGLLGRLDKYSEGDIERIAASDARRLGLVDRLDQARIDRLREELRAHSAAVREVAERLRAVRTEISNKVTDVEHLPALVADLEQREARRKLAPELDAARRAQHAEAAILAEAEGLEAKRTRALKQLALVLGESDGDYRAVAAKLAPLGAGPAVEAFQSFATFLEVTRTRLQAQPVDVSAVYSSARAALEERALELRDLETADVQDSLRMEDRLRRRIVELERHQPELQKLREQERELVAARARERAAIVKVRDEIFKLRDARAREINERFAGTVKLTVTPATVASDLKATIDRLVFGSKLHDQSKLAEDLTRLTPHHLLEAVETCDDQFLKEHLRRDKGQMMRLITHLAGSDHLYELETVSYEDQLEIALVVAGRETPMAELTPGQRAIALLPLMLQGAEHPLVFDEPERSLAHSHIYKTMARRIRELKHERQLIIATHEANICIGGDADRVLGVRKDMAANEALPPLAGALDDLAIKSFLVEHLEGGSEAFDERADRYRGLVR